jgi:hypothetical protein
VRKRKSHDPLAIDIARDMEKRTGRHVDVEEIETSLAKFRAAEQSDAAWDAFVDETRKKFDAFHDRADKFHDDAVKLAKMIEQLGQLAAREQGRRRAAVIKRERRREWAADMRREHAALVDEHRRSGEAHPATRAWNELAAQHGYDSGETLSRSVRRNDRRGQKILSG